MSTTRANIRDANALLDEWRTFQAPALTRMRDAAMALAEAADDYRASRIWANDVTRHDLSMDATIGGIFDHLRDEVGTVRRRLDEVGGDPDDIELDTAELEATWRTLKARADARLPNPRGAALVEALRESVRQP